MKTLTFKAYLSPSQKALVDQWLQGLKWVWNQGLRLLKELDEFSVYHKKDKVYYPCCPLPYEYRWEKDEDGQWKAIAPYSQISDKRGYLFCPLPQYGKIPELKSGNFYALSNWFTQQNHPDKKWFTAIPSVFVRGTLLSLIRAWDEFKKGKRKMPRFKGKNDKIVSLINEDAKKTKLEARKVFVSKKLGMVKVDRSLPERWIGAAPSVLKICKKASGYYLQLTGEIPYSLVPPDNNKAVGLDVGLKYVFATSDGETIDPPKFLRKAEKRLKRLQRSLSRRQKGSKRYAVRSQELARQHEKVADQRRLFNHALSTDLVSRYEAIAVEDLKLQNLMRRPKPKKRENGKGYEKNRASQKSGLNKSFVDNALGQLLGFIETKTKVTGGEFVRVNPQYTSQDCSNCGEVVKKTLSNRTHQCPHCGYVEDRDINAAINILKRGQNLFKKSYLGCTGKVTDGEIASSVVEPSTNTGKNLLLTTLEPLKGKESSDSSVTTIKHISPKNSKPRKMRSIPFVQGELRLWG